METLLSILVPTWNRRQHLEELLAVLLPQVEAHPEVNLVVSNNGSTDGTRDGLRRFENQPRVRIVHQPANLGANIHIAWLYGQATGRYLWLFCDDDMMDGDLVALACQRLRSRPDLGWVHLPGTHQLTSGRSLLTRCPGTDEFVPKARTLFPPYINWIGWASAHIIRTAPFHAKLPQVKFSTPWWPRDLLIRSIPDEPAAVLGVRKIAAGAYNTWADDYYRIQMRLMPLSILESDTLTQEEIRDCLCYRYSEWPESFRCLFRSDLRLLFRIASQCPALLWKTHLVRSAFRTVWRRMTATTRQTPQA